MNVQSEKQTIGFVIEPVGWQAPTRQDLEPLRARQRVLMAETAASISIPIEKGKRYGYFVINETDEATKARVRITLVLNLD